jgi:catechol 2,3-dioxygenase-like lactoylglutathione lyase family enzyme
METIIDDLLLRFQRGALTRRQLIQRLSMLVAAAGTAAAGTRQTGGLHGMNVDHVSVLVSDLQRSATFYRDLFGMATVSEDKPNQILRLGTNRTIVSLRREGRPGTVDHFAIRVQDFNKESVTEELKQHGITPRENVQFGFHIPDPDGAIVQVV